MVQPLTKKNKAGQVYARPRSIEHVIDAALHEHIEELEQRAYIRKKDAQGYLPLECLVHLIRKALHNDDKPTADALIRPLLERCMAILMKKCPDSRSEDRTDIREMILDKFCSFFIEDLSEGTLKRLDYYECKFNAAFASLRIDCLRKAERTAEKDTAKFVSIPAENTVLEDNADTRWMNEVVTALSTKDTPESNLLFRTESVKAIKLLSEDERKAVILHYIMGYKQESEDNSEITVAFICKVTGRTIRNRLETAARKLNMSLKEKV